MTFIKCRRFYLCCLLKKPVEKLAAIFRGYPVESKRILKIIQSSICNLPTVDY
ncbi:hypothetical protein KsCSTR_45750 [Candidatus Kuenenia stuttgartiensis]|uniref:Uncharacterized protein n=1 Tax=Kuenenia stuttgartiensis TaxID=174633 RepID=Q1PWF6_KUEST|nr:hypothetical protein KsCSTR_45750 [Candidatus Kuenenia stuttgartiensis]CAJ71564.1 unknown protein [Candidatus Kuenenia stuttgartiensis]